MELESWFQWLMRSTVQVSILVCIVLLVKILLRNRLAPRWHYCLWLLVIVRMVMPAAPQSSFSVFNLIGDTTEHTIMAPVEEIPQVVYAEETPVEEPLTTAEVSEPIAATQAVEREETSAFVFPPLAELLPIIWLVGALVLAVYVFAGNFRLWSIIKLKRPVTDSGVLDLLEDCKAQMKIHTPLVVVETDKVSSPALFGFLRPRLLLPEGMLSALNRAQLRHILLHELAHLKRGDIYLGWVVAILQTIHWFNPLVWFGFGRMRMDRELACDNLALSAMGVEEPAEYGRTIVKLLENFSKPKYTPSLAGILEERSQLKRRITMIAKFKKGSYRFSLMAVVLFVVLSVAALTNAKGTSANTEEKTELAESFVKLLIDKKYEQATQSFDNKMKRALPAAGLAHAWKSTMAQVGLFQRQLGTRTEKVLRTDIIYVTCQFESSPLDIKVVYNKRSQISGLWFVPVPQNVLKGYADQMEILAKIPEPVTEREVHLPEKVVLDLATGEIINPMKVFKDLKGGDAEFFRAISEYGKGDLMYDFDRGALLIGCLRGAKITDGEFRLEDGLPVFAAKTDEMPKGFTVTTKEGKTYNITVLEAEKGSCKIKYKLQKRKQVQQTGPQGIKPSIPIEISTRTAFLPGDSIEITEILGTSGKIEPGHTYLVKGKYTLSSRDEAQIHILSTNGSTSSSGGPNVKRGTGEFTRTLKYNRGEEGSWMQLKFCPTDNDNSFGDLFFKSTRKETKTNRRKTAAHIPPTSIINAEGRIEDKTDYPFVNDPEVIGGWKSVDFVGNIEDFKPAKKAGKVNFISTTLSSRKTVSSKVIF